VGLRAGTDATIHVDADDVIVEYTANKCVVEQGVE
jgi:hypothetical protein